MSKEGQNIRYWIYGFIMGVIATGILLFVSMPIPIHIHKKCEVKCEKHIKVRTAFMDGSCQCLDGTWFDVGVER